MRLIAGLAMLLWVLCGATGASAHASLVATVPGDGSVVAEAPKVVELRFNEGVAPVVVSLIDAAGKTRADAAVKAVDQSIFVTLPENLPRGTQVVSYRVISQDGHPVGGSLVFSIGAVTETPAEPAGSGTVAWLIWLARIGVYLGLFAGIGGAFFVGWIGRAPAATNIITVALVAGLFSALASLGLQGLDVLEFGLDDFLLPVTWKAALGTSLGPSLLVAIAAMAAGVVALRTASARLGRLLGALAMAGVGISLATTGHAATALPQWLTRPAVFLHGVGVAYWLGAFMPLVAMAARPKPSLLPVLNRFSRIAVPVVGVLVLTGLTLAVIQLASFRALIETDYGLILSVKLGLVIALLGLAALNRFRLTPALAADPAAARPLVRSIALEGLVAVGILAAVAGWRFTPPPRALVETADTPLAVHIHTDEAMFQILVSPGKVGADSFVLQLMQGDASPLVAKEATLILSLPERGIEPLERPATLGADGYWHVRGVPIPYPGRWHIRIEALVTDFKKITLEDELDVPQR
ncbi:CopD family protein [Bradyrhizobium sp. dw_78]|uniref:copper resistance CopC/CopD family protein n=1 Tax=Bradyrhizobium sp. dw_78 TaxID=2719793 RepID=UPI001BD6741C|nr:CopD family protein [Bradyrhizobium sp. dw_78]